MKLVKRNRYSQEILNIFKQLNQEKGLTIIVATHDTELGSQAKRTIYLQDGKIVSEQLEAGAK